MSVSTPILTTSSDIWARAADDDSSTAANPPATDHLLANIILSSRWRTARWPCFLLNACLTAILHLFGGSRQRRRAAIPSAPRRIQRDDVIRLHHDFPRIADGLAVPQKTARHSRLAALKSLCGKAGPAGDGIEQPFAPGAHVERDDLSIPAARSAIAP